MYELVIKHKIKLIHSILYSSLKQVLIGKHLILFYKRNVRLG